LKFDFSKLGDAFTDSIRMTLTNLLNEVFVTLFADNQPFISAITPGEFEAPMTYSLSVGPEVENAEKCIYIVEDSQLDIGLLIAVERNINRIFQIVSDYLSWNEEQIAESIRQQEEANTKKEQEPFDIYEEGAPEEKPKKKGFFGKIVDWFKGLFKKKRKDDKEVSTEDGEQSEEERTPRQRRKKERAEKKAARKAAREAAKQAKQEEKLRKKLEKEAEETPVEEELVEETAEEEPVEETVEEEPVEEEPIEEISESSEKDPEEEVSENE